MSRRVTGSSAGDGVVIGMVFGVVIVVAAVTGGIGNVVDGNDDVWVVVLIIVSPTATRSPPLLLLFRSIRVDSETEVVASSVGVVSSIGGRITK